MSLLEYNFQFSEEIVTKVDSYNIKQLKYKKLLESPITLISDENFEIAQDNTTVRGIYKFVAVYEVMNETVYWMWVHNIERDISPCSELLTKLKKTLPEYEYAIENNICSTDILFASIMTALIIEALEYDVAKVQYVNGVFHLLVLKIDCSVVSGSQSDLVGH